MLLGYIFFNKIFGYHPFKNTKDSPISEATERLMGPDFKTLRDSGLDASEALRDREHSCFTVTSDDGLALNAAYFQSPDCSNKTAILIHGHNSHGMKDNSLKAIRYLAMGYNVLLPDNRACGKSQGKWETFGAKESLDTLKWIDKLVAMDKDVEIFLDGCSLGGATVCLLADKELPDNVKFLVSDCAFSRAKDEFIYILKNYIHLPPFPVLYTMNWWDRIINHVDFKDQQPIESVRHAKKPMLFIHGEEDRYIPAENARQLYEACPGDKELVLIKNAGHAATCVKGKEEYFGPVLRFAARYM